MNHEKKALLIGGIALLAVAVFFCAVCTPVSVWADSDIQISESIFPTVWDLFQLLLLYLFYWIAVASLTALLVRQGIVYSLRLLLFYIPASLIRSVGGTTVGEWASGDGFDGSQFLENIGFACLDCLLDLLLLFLAGMVVSLLLLRKSTVKSREEWLPPSAWFRGATRLNGAVLLAVAIPSAFQLFGRIRYDVSFGAPQNTTDLLQMIFFYLSDLFSVLLGYLFAIWFLHRITGKEETEPQ